MLPQLVLLTYFYVCVQAHGETKQLLRIADGGQSSLSWLATVYAITLGERGGQVASGGETGEHTRAAVCSLG